VDGLDHDELVRTLPYVRRYARALTGSQRAGDSLVAGSLQKVMAACRASGGAQRQLAPRYRLYQAVTSLFDAQHAGAPDASARLPLKQRQLLVLTQLEEVPVDAAAAIVGLDVAAAGNELAQARERLRDAAATDVLIIEDEPIIAMDIEELVRDCGHRVIGVAASESEAVAVAMRSKPGLILADINLGMGGDGTSAVARILRRYPVPVIFVTAYPERLLTGEAVEPAFVITKPFDPMTLAIATYQAVTGGVSLD
jgi:CheY-like chemotaxis protein/DNA-directed RNA polymerase specialized sigma24 family protein